MLVTFVSIPIVTIISKVYGNYYRKLAKKVQVSEVNIQSCSSCKIDLLIYLGNVIEKPR